MLYRVVSCNISRDSRVNCKRTYKNGKCFIAYVFYGNFYVNFYTYPALFYWEIPKFKVTWFYFLLLALVGTLGNYFWTSALSKSDVTEVMPYDFTKLVFASLIGLFF